MKSARDYFSKQRDFAADTFENRGVDWWTKRKYDLDQGTKDMDSYLGSGNMTAEGNAKYRQTAQQNYDSLSKEMDSYGEGSTRYKQLSSYRDYYQNALGAMRQDDLQRGAQEFGGYYTDGKYTTENNAKYRRTAEQMVKDLDEEMKGYKKDSDYYKMLETYRDYYSNGIKSLDRTDGAASISDYILADSWHSGDDFAAQKKIAEDNIAMLTAELAKIEDAESDEYKITESYKQMYEELLKDLDTRKEFDDGFAGPEDYNSYTKRNDYKYSAELSTTLKQKQAELAKINPEYANMTAEDLSRQLRNAETELQFEQTYGSPDSYDRAKKQYDALVSAQELVSQIGALQKDKARLEQYQDADILYKNYGGYNSQTDYQKVVDDLREQLKKTTEGTEAYEKIQAQIRALAGENGDGTNADGIYDENTFLGRSIMDHFDVEAAQKRLDEIEPELSALQREIDTKTFETGEYPTDLSKKYNDLLAEKRTLTQQMNSSAKLQERTKIDQAYSEIPEVGGQYGKGNLDLINRNTGLRDSEGNLMTVKSMSFEEDGKEILIPTIVKKNGKWVELSDDEAIAWYHKTGEYLGKFDSVEEANKYADALHRQQENLYVKGKSSNLPSREQLTEAGEKLVSKPGDSYAYRGEKTGFGLLKNYDGLLAAAELDGRYGEEAQQIKDMLLAALGAEEAGISIGYTAADVLDAYEGQINELAGYADAKKISEMDSDFLRWNRQVFGVGVQSGLNQFATGTANFFKGVVGGEEDLTPNRIAAKAAFTREDLKRYGGEDIFGSNVSQLLFDTTQTTANMLPMIVASSLATAAVGPGGLAIAGAEAAGKIGAAVGAASMGLSSAGNSYQQAISEGWDKDDARTFALITGAAEGAMQYLIGGISSLGGVSEEGLLRAAQGINNAAVRIATKTGIHIASETAEELAQNRLERFLNYQLFDKGSSDWYSWTDDDWYTVIVTALSTGLMEAPGTTKTDIQNTRLGKQLTGEKSAVTEKDVKDIQKRIESKKELTKKQQWKTTIDAIGSAMKGDEALAYTLTALGSEADPDSEAYKLAEKMKSGKLAKTANNYGTLFSAILSENKDAEKTLAAVAGGGLKYNEAKRAQAQLDQAIGDLDEANTQLAKLRESNPGATVLNRTATNLQKLGADPVAAVETSAVLNKIRNGQAISSREMAEITGNSNEAKAARRYLAETTGDADFAVDADSSVTEALVTNLISTNREQKKIQAEQLQASVIAAANEAAAGIETARATAGATKIVASDVKDLQNAKAKVAAAEQKADVAKQRVDAIENASFNEMAEAGSGDQLLINQLAHEREVLRAKIEGLTGNRMPSKAQARKLADLRRQYAEVNEKLQAAAGTIISERTAEAAAENAKVEAEAKKPGAIPPKGKAAEPAGKSDADTVTIKIGGTEVKRTRAEFVADKTSGDNAISEEEANRQFDDMVAVTTGQELAEQKGDVNNGRQQATDRNEERNDLGEQRDRAEDSERGDRSEQGAVGGNEAPRTRALSTASGKEAAKVTEGAIETTGENAAGLESKYPGVEKLAKYLMNSGVKRVVYVTDGQILNAVGEPVAGVYYDGEIFLNLNYKGGYHYSVTADHERMHARLALYKAALAERYGNDEAAQAKALADTREFVASALESILGEDAYADAFGKYWDPYAETYLKAGAKPEDIMYMVCEEMLSDMVAGMNNFGAQLGIYADEANDFLEVSKFDAAIKSIVAGENPSSLEYALPADNNMPFGLTFKELRPGDVKDAFKNEVDTDVPPEQRPLPGDEPMHPELSLLSQQSLTEGTGLKLRYNDLGYVDAVIDPKTGEKVTKVTPEMMKNTPLGKLVQDAIIKTDDNGKIISGHITQEQADAEYKLLADAMNLITRYNDAPLVWEVVGSQLFSGVKKNSDTQYNYTIDFGTICRKTQAIVNVMSETMKYLKRGLSRREVEEVYLAVGKSGEATPCPVCYVFSRWMGIGGLLDQINRYQNEYFDINQKTGEFTWKVDRQQVLEFMKEQETLAEQHVRDILKDKQAAVDKARAELEALSPNADEETRTKAEEKLDKAVKSLENKRKDFLDENGYLKYGGILSDMKSNSAIEGAIQKINQLDQGDRLNEELLAKVNNATPEQQKKFLEIIKKNRQNKMAILKTYAPAERAAYDALAKEFNAVNKKNKIKKDNFTAEQRAELDAAMLRATEAAKDGLDEALAAARAENDPVEKYQWLAKTVLSLKPGVKGERIWEFNEDYKPVKQEILFDLNKGADFAKDYPLTWGFRTGKGCAMGKAIMPYSDARVGETLQGVVSSNGLRVLSDKMLEGKSEEEQKALRSQYGIMSGDLNPFLNGDELQSADVVTKARAWARRQNLIGGMRYQSTSDFRFEWGSDYLITFFELQAIGANVQLYTKVIEAVDFLASTHSDCNLSVMPLGDGYVQVGTDENGEPIYELAYSGVTGIDKDAALEKVHQYDNVQLILVGINDLNIRLALASEDVTFVIPFHGSGQSVHQVQTLMDLLKEDLDVNKARDYSDVQTDHFKKNRTAEEKAMWDLRMDIIMGNCLGGLNEKQQALIAKNKHLDKLYKMFYEQTENKAYHCFLAKEQASQIFPYEYWDTTTTYATADRNGQIFQDYCESMGIIPRFSGKDSSGKDVGFGDFTKDKGYWKLLIDRKMYANTYDASGNWTGYGAYRDQEKVTTDNIKIGMLDESTVAEGRGDWAAATTIPEKARTKPIRSEKTQAIMMEAIYGTENPDDKIQVTGIKNLEKAGLNEIDRTKMTKGFRERYLNAKSELRNVPKENIPVYALAMTDPRYETSKREAPVTDDRGQVLFVEPNTAGWSVDRDSDGSLLNTDYIIDELGMPIFRNPKDAYSPPEKRDVVPPKHRTSNPSTQDTYKHIFDEYVPQTYGDDAKDLLVVDASSGLGLGANLGKQKLGEENVIDLEPYPGSRTPVPDYKEYGGLIYDMENGQKRKADFIISNAVINVMAQDAREEHLAALLRMMDDNGTVYINPAFPKRGWDAYKKAIPLEEYKQRKANGEDVSKLNVMLVPDTKTTGAEIYTAGSNSVQKGYAPEEFIAFAKDVAKQTLGYDVDVRRANGVNGLKTGFLITKAGSTAPESSRFSIQLTPEQESRRAYNERQTETGSELKTLNGDKPMTRSKTKVNGVPANVGKQMGDQIWVHKQYVDRVVPKDILDHAKAVLAEKYPSFQYNTIMYDKKTGNVRFDEAPNFDTAREPIPGGMVTIMPNGDTKVNYNDQIWHHKWMWVDNDYKGFDVNESWNWSKQWLSELQEPANGSTRGPVGWDGQMEKYGLPTDPASEVEIKDKKAEIARIEGKRTKPVIPAKNAPKSSSVYSIQPGEEEALIIKNDTKRGVNFVEEILNDKKHGETRALGTHSITPGKWYGLSNGGKNSQVVGRVKFGEPVEISSDPNSENYNLYKDAQIEGTDYDLKPGETKLYYPIVEKEDFRRNPKPVLRTWPGHGAYKRDTIPAKNALEKRAEESVSRFSIQPNLREDLTAVENQSFPSDSSDVLIGDTSDFLVTELGFDPLPNYMAATKAYRAIKTEAEAIADGKKIEPGDDYHGLGVAGLYDILSKAETPIAAFIDTPTEDNQRGDRLVLVTDQPVNGGLGAVIVTPNQTGREAGHRRSANRTITVYDNQGAISAVQQAYDQNRLLYINKESGQIFDSGRSGAKCPTAISETARRNNIQQFWGNVKWRDMKGKTQGVTADTAGGLSPMEAAFANPGRIRTKSPQSTYSIQNTNTPRYAESQLDKDIFDLVSTKGPEALGAQVDEWLANHEATLENAKIKAPAIPSKGFVPRVTSSERTTLDRMMQEQIKRYGKRKPSEKSNGFVIPKKRQEGENYRGFYQNVGSAENLPADAQDLTLRQLMTSAESTYVPDSDAKLIEGAKDKISDVGYGAAMAVFKSDAKDLKMGTKGMLKTIALGEQLIIEAAHQGDAANMLETIASVAELGTTIGKSLQAYRLLKMSGPIGELWYVDKAVKRINNMNEDRIKKGTANKIVAKPELCQAVIDAKTAEERDEAMRILKQDLADQCPKTLWDRWNAWRYLSMLGNVRTHVRNLIGNAVFVPLRYTKDLLAAGGEFLATKAGWMAEEDRQKAVLVSRELRDFALADADVMQKELQGNGKYNPAQEILGMRKLLPGFLDTLSRINSNGIEGSKLVVGLEGEDWAFLRPAYARALAMQLEHSPYSLDELQGDPEGQRALNEMRKVAIEEAQKATYRDFSAVASWLNRGKQLQGAGRIAAIGLEGVLPFTKTPINILKRGVEYSPVGIAKGIATILTGLKSGELDVAEAIDQLSAGLTGTAVAALGWLLARMGWLRGKKSDDDEENFDKLQGAQDYSIQIGDQSFTIDWAAPTALPLFVGAAVADLMEEDHEMSWGDAWNAIMLIAEPMTSLSMLDGLNKLLDSTSYASGSEKIATVATQAATSYLGQAFPTILGQLARTIDGTRRSTYIDKNSPVPAAIQRFVQTSVQNKTPGWENAKVPYIDAWGRQSKAGSMVLNGIENFFMPFYRSVKNTTDVDEELQRLHTEASGDVLPRLPEKKIRVDGKDRYLTADEWVSFATDVGQTKYSLLTQLIYDPRYLALSDNQKAKAIEKYIYPYALAAGKFHVYPDYDIRRSGAAWMQEAEAAATDYERFERIWQQIEKGLQD